MIVLHPPLVSATQPRALWMSLVPVPWTPGQMYWLQTCHPETGVRSPDTRVWALHSPGWGIWPPERWYRRPLLSLGSAEASPQFLTSLRVRHNKQWTRTSDDKELNGGGVATGVTSLTSVCTFTWLYMISLNIFNYYVFNYNLNIMSKLTFTFSLMREN